LAAVAKAHDAWVEQNLSAVAGEFDPAAHPKDGSDYNQHNLDVDATGGMEDELAQLLAGVFDDPLTAAGDPDWDPSEHPRGPDGKFIESVGAADAAIKELEQAQAVASLAKSVAYLKGENYKALEIQADLLNIQKDIDTYEKGKKALLKKGKTGPSPAGATTKVTPKNLQVGQYVNSQSRDYLKESPKQIKSISKKGDHHYLLDFEDGSNLYVTNNEKVVLHSQPAAKEPLTAVKADDPDVKNKVLIGLPDGRGAYVERDDPAAPKVRDIETDEILFTGKNDADLYQQMADHFGVELKYTEDLTSKMKIFTPKKKGAAKPITAWTKTIFSGKYGDGEVVAVKDDGSARLTWDEGSKKFQWEKKTPGGWKLAGLLTKKDAYAKFKDEKTSWQYPVPGAAVTEDAPPSPLENLQSHSLIDSAIAKGDFSQLKQIGGNAGTTPGGFFEAPDGSRWYVKGQKTQEHANNEALASALYRAAGIDVPEVIRGSGTPGLPGTAHTATRIVEGANQNLPEALNDQDYVDKIREGFALDAWLANWDVVGEGDENPWGNIIEGSDGKPHRIDVGGALLFRGLGTYKGSAFGKEVTEFERMRDTSKPSRHVKIFSGMSQEQIDASVARVKAISPDQIRELTSKYGMDPELADLLIDRRENLIMKVPAPDPVKIPAPTPVISPTSSAKKTVWTKGKFNTTLAYKSNYQHREIVGMTESAGETKLILWESGKFRSYRHVFGSGWQYEGTWTSKKAALEALKDAPLYRPPAGTMADTNKDFIHADLLNHGGPTITATDSTDLFQELYDAVPPISTETTIVDGIGIIKSLDGDKAIAYNNGGDNLGGIHQNSKGEWVVTPKNYLHPFMSTSKTYASKEAALKALVQADNAYMGSIGARSDVPAAPAAPDIEEIPLTKKMPKLTAAQIEKQNGAIPKSLKQAQRTDFLKNFKENSSVGFVHSGEDDAQKVFTAVVYAVKKHNATESPKLNYLQGLNLLDSVYGTGQKARVVSWLQTSEGKALAPVLTSGLDSGHGLVIPADAHVGVPSPYSIGKPKKVAQNAFQKMSLADMLEMHEKMYAKKPMTSGQRSRISQYKDGSNEFNQPLRGHAYSPLDEYSLPKIQELQEAMRPVTRSFVVFRGTDGLGSAINKDTIKTLDDLKKFEGSVIGDPAFLSTSFDPNSAFTGKKFKLFISIPEGTPGTFAYAADSSFHNEKEFTLAAGLHYRIDRVEETPYSGFNVYMTVVPEVKKK